MIHRQYIGSRGHRAIPVGYSAADVESNRYEMASYMNCGTADQRSDFFAFNDYSWCDPSSSYTISGKSSLRKSFARHLELTLFSPQAGTKRSLNTATTASRSCTSTHSPPSTSTTHH